MDELVSTVENSYRYGHTLRTENTIQEVNELFATGTGGVLVNVVVTRVGLECSLDAFYDRGSTFNISAKMFSE